MTESQPQLTPTLTADMNFDVAAGLVLAYLSEEVPLAFWSVTRVENGRQTYLYADPNNGYGLPVGGSHPWEDSFCIHMAAGRGPHVAPDAQAVPVYAGAAINEVVPIRSYAGAVITEADGSLFGAICGIDPRLRTDDPRLLAAAPLLRLLGQLLTMALAADRNRDSLAAALSLAQLEAETDAMTGLYNKRAWQRFIAEEDARYQRFADPTVAVMLDLDRLKSVNDTLGHKAGDAYIRAAASALRRAIRSNDVAARLGGDEFGLLLRGCTEIQAKSAVARIYAELDKAGVAGSVGWAPVTVIHGFPAAIEEADHAMYRVKQARRRDRVLGAVG